MVWYYLPYLLPNRWSCLFSAASAGISTVDILSTWWLVIRSCPNVELSKVLMAVINFLFKSPSWSLLLLESAKFTFDMTSQSQQGSCSKDPARVEFTFTLRFGHVSEAAFAMCGNLNKVISTGDPPQPAFGFAWPAWLH